MTVVPVEWLPPSSAIVAGDLIFVADAGSEEANQALAWVALRAALRLAQTESGPPAEQPLPER